MRRTKIICTIGPASANEETITLMCKAGMNVARLNFSHGDHETHKKNIELIKKVREKLGLPVAIMLDTKGPEYRIGNFKDSRVTLSEGTMFTLTPDEVLGDETKVSVNYPNLFCELTPGDTILINNGLVNLEVSEINGRDILCKVISGGVLSNKKSMSFPGKVLKNKFLSNRDKCDLLFGIENDIDFVAASFVSCQQDICDIKNFLYENGRKNIGIIAKIENRAGIENVEKICEHCDGIMIARGDLGVEIPFIEVPSVQKYIITKCRLLGKRVITATEMLESMIYNPRPTRAEISDVANAVYDGTSAIMLSGESAAGKYPVNAVKVMSEIAEETERHINYTKRFLKSDFKIKNQVDALSHATCSVAIDINAKAIAVYSASGKTVRMISRFRVPVDIMGITSNKKAWYKLALSWGVIPVYIKDFVKEECLPQYTKTLAKEILRLKEGDSIVITTGSGNNYTGNTDTIKLENI